MELLNKQAAAESPWNELAAILSLRALDNPEWDDVNEQIQTRIRPILDQISHGAQKNTETAMYHTLTHLSALHHRHRTATEELIRRGVLPDAPPIKPNTDQLQMAD